MVSTPLKKLLVKLDHFPKQGWKLKKNRNHHLVIMTLQTKRSLQNVARKKSQKRNCCAAAFIAVVCAGPRVKIVTTNSFSDVESARWLVTLHGTLSLSGKQGPKKLSLSSKLVIFHWTMTWACSRCLEKVYRFLPNGGFIVFYYGTK